MRARRAILYTPGNDLYKIRKAAALEVDSICLDLEDAVAPNRKDAARQVVVEALHEVDFGLSERLVRVNPWDSREIDAILQACPDGIVIPKVESGDAVAWVANHIREAEAAHRWPPGQIAILAMIETARGLIELKEIASAGRGLQALIFGGEDFITDLGAQRTPERQEVFFARSAILSFSAANDLQAIDMIYLDYRDADGLVREARQGAQMGFSGKQVIHPSQVDPVQQAFTPDAEAIQRAEELIRTFTDQQQGGHGVYGDKGKLVELPHYKAAERILARARAAGKTS